MRLSITSLLVLFLFWLLSCSQFDQEKDCASTTTLYPNNDSELTLLMREMFEDGMRMKQQIEKGEHPEVRQTFEQIYTAKATDPEKAESDQFKAFADYYLSTAKKLQDQTAGNTSQLFHEMVESCMSCHRVMCPGPMVRIEKLYLAEE